jgi:hypothetical protein
LGDRKDMRKSRRMQELEDDLLRRGRGSKKRNFEKEEVQCKSNGESII